MNSKLVNIVKNNKWAAKAGFAIILTIFFVSAGRGFAQEPTEPPIKTQKPDYKSLMFKQEQIGWVAEALKAYEQNISLEMLLPSLFPSNNKVQDDEPVADVGQDEILDVVDVPLVDTQDIFDTSPVDAPSFNLKSILFFSPENWTIWLNDKKISKGDNYNNLEIVNVTSTEVTFLWRESNLDRILPNWQEVFSTLGNEKYLSNNKNIVVNSETRDVSFILQPNQTLVTRQMLIIEGTESSMSPDQGLVSEPQSLGERMLFGDDSDLTPEEVVEKKNNSLLRGHNPADGIENMQKYMMQLNMLKSIIDEKEGENNNNGGLNE